MSNFSLEDISEAGQSQPDSPWIRYTVNCGPGAPGHALVNEPQVADLGADEIRAKILDRLEQLAGAQTKPVVIAQLRTSGIRVHMNM